jgi:hypothetical protein
MGIICDAVSSQSRSDISGAGRNMAAVTREMASHTTENQERENCFMRRSEEITWTSITELLRSNKKYCSHIYWLHTSHTPATNAYRILVNKCDGNNWIFRKRLLFL